ncbi:MAG: hypothetical protein RIS55_1071 [Actinomycetota bacterium]|jgi:hypothetical protein
MTKPDAKRFLEVARAAATQNAGEKAVSNFVELIDEGDGAYSFVFEAKLEGYQGWLWSVTLFDSGDESPTISEVVLLPGEQALLAPAWVPWSERLADWKALQVELEAQAALEALEAGESTEDDDDDEDDDLDEIEEDEDGEAAESEDVEPEDSASAELAPTDLEPGEDAEDDSEDAAGKPPLFARWGRRRNKNKKR